jgi:hypothetical protein
MKGFYHSDRETSKACSKEPVWVETIKGRQSLVSPGQWKRF